MDRWLIILPLASWRITRLIYQDKIAEPLRRLLGEEVEENEFGEILIYPDTFTGNLISCHSCVSVWGAFLACLTYLICPWLLVPLALSAVTILIERWT